MLAVFVGDPCGSADQHQTLDALRVLGSVGQRDVRPGRVAEQRDRVEPEMISNELEILDMVGKAVQVVVRRRITSSAATRIDQHQLAFPVETSLAGHWRRGVGWGRPRLSGGLGSGV